jgi:hypothetical protein
MRGTRAASGENVGVFTVSIHWVYAGAYLGVRESEIRFPDAAAATPTGIRSCILLNPHVTMDSLLKHISCTLLGPT